MPPVLGWAAVANDVSAQALVLFLIVFLCSLGIMKLRSASEI